MSDLNIPVPVKLPPFKAWLASNIPAVYDNTMSYYDELTSLIAWLEKEVVPNVNEAIELVNMLKDYVENYFKNLDVQEEINNKLDQMAEDGTLQEIITAYIQANVAWAFDTVADMKSAETFINGSFAQTLGYHTKNDGGNGIYKIRTITNDDVIDEASIIELSDDSLIAELIYDKYELNVKQFGAYGDNTHDDTDALQKCVDFAYKSKVKRIILPEGIYCLSEPIEIYENKNYDLNFDYSDTTNAGIGYPISKLEIVGSEKYDTMLKATAGDYIFRGYATTPKAVQDITFRNIYFNGNGVAKTAMFMNIVHFWGRMINFIACSFNSFTEAGIKHTVSQDDYDNATGNYIKLVVDECYIANNDSGIEASGDDTFIRNCTIQNNTKYGVYVHGSYHNYHIEDCKIQYNGRYQTTTAGCQLMIRGTGTQLSVDNTYFEPKSSNAELNDAALILIDRSDLSTSKVVQVISINNCYIQGHGSPCVISRIGDVEPNTISLHSNFITGIKTDSTPYVVYTDSSLLSQNGINKVEDIANRIVISNSSNVDYSYYYLTNEYQRGYGGNIKTRAGVWSPNTQANLCNEIPSIIIGSFTDGGSNAMRKIGDYDVTKDPDNDGVFHVTFTRPISCYGFNGNYYPVMVNVESNSKYAQAFVSNKSANGFDVTTGTWDSSTHATFTPNYLRFSFIAGFLTKG